MNDQPVKTVPGARHLTRYAIVAEAVAGDIESGRYPVGTAIPTEFELTRRYAVSRNTVRQALNALKQQGLLSAHAGLGTIVRAKPQAYTFSSGLSAISELLQFVGQTRMIIASQREREADEGLAALLHCEQGQAWQELSCIRQRRDAMVPIGFVTVYVRAEFGAVLSDLKVIEEPVYAILEKHHGLRIVEVQQSIGAEALPADIAQAISAEPGEAALMIIRHFLDFQGRVVQVSVGYFPKDRYRQESSFRATTMAAGIPPT